VSRRGFFRYGVDAPLILGFYWAGFGITVVWTVVAFVFGWHWTQWVFAFATLYWLFAAVSFMYTTLRGKFVVWSRVLDRLALGGSERVVDLGCGRGAVLVAVARRLTDGRALGVDLWRSFDHSGNSEALTRENAADAGVSDRVDLMTGDLRALPLPDACADVVLSSVAIHGIPALEDRDAAVREAYRVLAPGGRLRIADFRNAPYYAEVLRHLGATDVRTCTLGWRFWYGGPLFTTWLVSAAKPG
jgi:ubiquinone/menaquinone biosynthesis C-methylase UbiE